jgi:hypothetical protein
MHIGSRIVVFIIFSSERIEDLILTIDYLRNAINF